MPRIKKKFEPVHSEGANPMMVDFKTDKWPISTVIYKMQKNQILTDDEVQRGFVWNTKQKSLLIHSIICGYPIPYLVAIKDGKRFNLLDGKQRITTVVNFCNNKFVLKNIPPIIYDDNSEDDYNNLKFSDLPEDVQKSIETYSFNLFIFSEGTSKEEASEIFYRFNNGTSLKSSDKNFSKAVSKDKISYLINHPIFDKAMTETAREKLASRQVVIHSYIMLLTEDYSLDSGDVSKFLSEYEITDNDCELLNSLFTRLLNISDVINDTTAPGTLEKKAAKKILSRSNIPTLIRFISIHNDDDKNIQFFKKFFASEHGGSISKEYNSLVGAGSGHTQSIQGRDRILNEEFNKM